ncbi:YesL family protein [Evansella clarkii]|uniref:YesL family protein n=1 Tax=Evansella clarkii TaxID=79879 RepID=UPI0009972FA0|nr:DUF624 domain-containing protein [Evansella clarkii]
MGRALYSMLEWITRFAYINLLWVLFTLAGGIILGLFPAITAIFSVIRQWLNGNSDLPVFHTYWNYYRSEFWKSNLLGLPVYLVSFVFLFNVFFLYANIGELLAWTSAPLLAGILLFLFYLFYLFPAYVHFDLNILQIMKNALLIMLISPVNTFLMVISLSAFTILVYVIPPLGFIFGASFYSFITLWFALHAFRKVQKKQSS